MSKRKYLSIKEIISSMSEEKRDSLTIWDRYVLRVPSYYVAYIFYNIFHLSANAVSILSALYISMLFLLVYYSPTDYFSYVLFWMNLWALLDCVDGNIARALKLKYHESNPYGDMYDAISGYFVIAGLWITVGYYLSIFYDDIGYLLVGALSSILGIFSRLINILMRLNFHNHNHQINKTILYRFLENLEIGSFLMPILLVSFYGGVLGGLIYFYLMINGALFLYALYVFMRKTMIGNFL